MIKWIGQHIVDLIARFRSDVYLDDIADGTVANNKFLGLDSNNKIVKEAITPEADITAVKIQDEAGTHVTYTAGQATVEIVGSGVISTSLNGSTTLTVSHDDTSSQASVDNSGSTVIQDVTLDTYGHVTGLASKTIGKSDVGLSNVDNVSEATLTTNILAAATKADVGLTNVEDKSSADIRGEISASDVPNIDTSKITTGILSVARGGTGLNAIGTLLNSNTTKSDVGLGNVENTALSTYTGSGGALDNQYIANGAGYTTNTGTITQVSIAVDDGGSRLFINGNAGFFIKGGEGIDTDLGTGAETGHIFISGEDASDSNKGIVELATTAEADTGTDTARAVTPAGLKSHVDARVIPWLTLTGQFNPGSSDKYYAPSNQGALNTSWTGTGVSGGVDYFVDTGANANKVPFFKQNGIIIPSACTIVSMRGYVRYGVSKSYKFKFIKLAAADIKYNTNGTPQGTAICEATVTFTDNNTSRYAPMSFDGSVSLAQGDMIIPMIKNTDGDYSANTHFQFSFSIKV